MSTSDSDGGRDPSSGRFRPGQSGNLHGRPRKAKTVGDAITGAFSEKVQITERGRRRKITKLEAAAKQIANQSASGDPKSVKLGMELAQKAEERQSRAPATPAQLSETDQQIAERLIARLQKMLLENLDERNTNDSDAD